MRTGCQAGSLTAAVPLRALMLRAHRARGSATSSTDRDTGRVLGATCRIWTPHGVRLDLPLAASQAAALQPQPTAVQVTRRRR